MQGRGTTRWLFAHKISNAASLMQTLILTFEQIRDILVLISLCIPAYVLEIILTL